MVTETGVPANTVMPAQRRWRQRAFSELRPRAEEIVLHGHRVSYRVARIAGDGSPVVLLIHGIVGCAEQWDQVIPLLAERYTVLVPDLPGHGGRARAGARETRPAAGVENVEFQQGISRGGAAGRR